MQQDASSDQAGRWTRTTESGATEAPFEPLIHAVIADHKLIRCIGRGAYGEVWLARHTMGMYRAVKIVHRKYFRDRHPFERELSGIRKFEPISRSHRGFIDILHVGMHEGGDYFYYVMELGDDQRAGSKIDPDSYCPKTLSRELRSRGTMDYQQGLQLGLDLSRALAELHRKGLVHRDIKPSNILFVNDVPKLADIGLVTEADETCSYVGTDGFIPPEGPGAAQADVYALGKVLYEAITGKDRLDYPELPPDWDGRTGHEKLQELNEVILHACNDAPQRYQTAESMHADLVVLLAGKSVRRLKSLERQVAQLKRWGALAAILGLLSAIGVYMVLHERDMALQVRQAQVASLLTHGNRAVDSGDVGGALPYFAEVAALHQRDRRSQAQDRIRFGSALGQCPKIVQMWFTTNPVSEVDFSADGQRILIAESLSRAQVFDVNSGRPITPRFGETNVLLRGSFSADGSMVATANEDKTVCIWGAGDGRLITSLYHENCRPLCATFSPDDRHLISGCTDSQAWIWDVSTWKCIRKLAGHTSAVLFATYSHDGKLIATSSRDSSVRIWDAETGRQIGHALQHPRWVDFVAFSPDNQFLLTACEDCKARLWNVRTQERLPPDMVHDEMVSSADFSPDARLIVTGCFDGTARIWLASDHQPFAQAPVLRHSDKVKHVMFAPDGRRIVTGCTDRTVRIWDLAGMVLGAKLNLHSLSEDRTKVVTLESGYVHVRDVVSNQEMSRMIKPTGEVRSAKLSANGAVVVSLSFATQAQTGILEFWETQTGMRIGSPMVWSNGLENVQLSSNGKRFLAFGCGFAHVFELPGINLLATCQLDDQNVRSALLSPDGTIVAIWSERILTLYDARTGKSLSPPLEHAFPITDVEFSGDSQKLVSCGADQTLSPCSAQLWDPRSGKGIGSPLIHADGVLCSIFSPKVDFVLTGGEDSRAIVWQLNSPNQVFVKHHDKVFGVCFSPDQSSFATASLDRTARVWSTDTADPLTPALRHHSSLNTIGFLPDGVHLITLDSQHRAWLWTLSSVERPLEDTIRISRLLSGAVVLPISEANPRVTEPLSSTWQLLRSRYPEEWTVSSEQIANWYDFQAEESEIEENPRAAIFYLEHLQELRPQDASISPRLLHAQKELQNLSN